MIGRKTCANKEETTKRERIVTIRYGKVIGLPQILHGCYSVGAILSFLFILLRVLCLRPSSYNYSEDPDPLCESEISVLLRSHEFHSGGVWFKQLHFPQKLRSKIYISVFCDPSVK